VDAELICERFGLDEPLSEPMVAASGWGHRNLVWRLETRRGVFAVKEVVAELLPDKPDIALRIESFAHAAGVPSAEPVPSMTGAAFEHVDGRWYRCHRWVDGTAKQNEDATAHDAHEMGILVAGLHRLQLEAGPLPPVACYGRAHWRELAGHAPRTRWGGLIHDHLDAIDAAEAFGATFDDTMPIGSHCDLNAHNVLFTAAGLVLVDWDAAGPASAIYERASTAVLWAQRHDGRLDPDVAAAFLRGYRGGGGTVSSDDVTALPRWLTGVAWWTERNVHIAVTQSSDKHDELATHLVGALINGVETVKRQQRFLHGVIARL
jgi:Ser/Thr protein kinase RdoA (MazF antagonist)